MADWPAKKNAIFTVTFPIYDADGDLVTGAAALDSEVSKDGGDFADCTNEATEVATASGVYKLALTATEMNADIVCTITKTSTAGAKTAVNVMYTVVRQLVDLAFPVTSGRGLLVEADNMVHADLKEWLGVAPLALSSQRVQTHVGSMAAAVVTAAVIATDALDADAFKSDALAEIADAVWDEDIVAAHGTADTAGLLLKVLGYLISTRSNNPTLNALLGVADGAGVDLPEQVWSETTRELSALGFVLAAADIGADAIGASEFAQGAADKVWASAARTLTALGFVLAASDIGTDAIGAAELASDAVNEIRDAILSDSTPFAGAAITEARLSELDAATGGKMAFVVDELRFGLISAKGSVSDVGATTTDFDTDLTEASDDHYNTLFMVFTSGNLAGQVRRVQDYTGSTKNFAFDRAWTEAPGDGDDFMVLACISSALDTWLARLADWEGEAVVSNRISGWLAAKLINKVDASGASLSVKKTDDSTELFAQAITTDVGAVPITVLDTS